MADGTVQQKIKICYKFIGFVDELHITPTKRWSTLPPQNCTVCGVEYVPGSGVSKYCPVCARKVRLERSNESRRRSREQKMTVCIELSAKNDRLVQTRENSHFINTAARQMNRPASRIPATAATAHFNSIYFPLFRFFRFYSPLPTAIVLQTSMKIGGG